jgi:hypothetical protein
MHQSSFKPQPSINWQPAQACAMPMIENYLTENAFMESPLTDRYIALLSNKGPYGQYPAVAVT